MTRVLPLRCGERLRARQLHRLWQIHRVVEAGGASVGDIRARTSPPIIDVDPISAVPGGAEDLVRDQPQFD
jgi:hypothetical protein